MPFYILVDQHSISVIKHIRNLIMSLRDIMVNLAHMQYIYYPITLTPYMVLPLFATRFADYAGGIKVSFIQPRLF